MVDCSIICLTCSAFNFLLYADGCVFGATCVGAKDDGSASGVCTPFIKTTSSSASGQVWHASSSGSCITCKSLSQQASAYCCRLKTWPGILMHCQDVRCRFAFQDNTSTTASHCMFVQHQENSHWYSKQLIRFRQCIADT